MRRFHPLLLSFLTGLLLFAAWPVSPLSFLVFVAFIPLLWLEQQGIRRKKFFGWVYLSMLIWNASTTWWIWNASAPGAIGAILANSLLMCLPWLGFHFVNDQCRKGALPPRWTAAIGYLSLIVFWLSFEYFHLSDWGLSWPWLTLGNVFATHPGWVQWYEYTGVSGGGLWVLGINVLIFRLLQRKAASSAIGLSTGIGLSAAIVIPLILSSILQRPPQDKERISNVVIVQPNIDPYEKLFSGTFEAQLQKLIRLSESSIDSHTVLVVWPETALYMENPIDEAHLKENYFLRPLWDFLRRHPAINLLTGIESFRFFDDPHGGTARKLPNGDKYIEDYNAATLLDSSGPLGFYHKTMLVPGVETLPSFLHILDSWFEKFGGTTAGYTGQKERTVFTTSNHSYQIAPAVCYESIYGEFMSRYVRNGADLIAIITNDGWWGNTPGYRQHENYARLRAIETRRWVVRSANTGVSCIIQPNGDITYPQPWEQMAVLKQPVGGEDHVLTFYVQYGDWISKGAIALAILCFGWTLWAAAVKRRGRRV